MTSWLSDLAALAGQGGMFARDYLAMMTSSPQQVAAHVSVAIGIACVSAAAFVRTMVPLRWLAVGSNVGLLGYGMLHPSPPTLAIAVALLPINLWRAVEIMRLTYRVERSTQTSEMAGLWLRPYMKRRRLRAGRVLFHKGDRADRLYLLVDGELELADIGQRMTPGRIFGEVALFSAAHERTHTVRARTACTVLEIHESTVRQLYYQNPSFGFHLIGLLAERLGGDVARAEQQLESLERSRGA